VWRWTFRDGRDQRYDPVVGMLAQPHFDTLTPPGYDDDPEVMLFARRDPEDLSLREVSRYVDQTGSNASGQGAAYAMRYHAILSSPAICFVVIAVAIPFAVVGGRINPMVGVAKTFGLFLAFFFLSSLCSAFGVSGALYPVVAAWLPTALTAAWAIPKLRSVN
jgi:lipopolysaccharide export system permease protein